MHICTNVHRESTSFYILSKILHNYFNLNLHESLAMAIRGRPACLLEFMKQRHYCFVFSVNQSDDPVIAWLILNQTINNMLSLLQSFTEWGLDLQFWDHVIMLENVIIERYWPPVSWSHVWVMFISVADWLTDCSRHQDTWLWSAPGGWW